MTLRLLFYFLIFFGIACENSQQKEEIILAEVNDAVLTLQDAKSNISASEFNEDSVAAYNSYKNRWIERQLILEETKRLKLLDSPDVQRKVDRAKEEMLLISFQEAILSKLESDIIISDQEVRNYYQTNKDKFILDERYVRFRHLIAATLSDAENARRDLMRGISWENVARQYSLQSDLVISNASRFWPESSALKEFDTLNRYLRLIGVSEISLIENINDQYHFVQLLESKAVGEHPDLDWLLDQIENWLILEKKRIAYNTYVKNLYLAAEANNEIHTYNVLPNNTNTELVSDTLNSNQ
ncbi:MAG: hypothetical protein CL671_06300 [Balneola sp.]|jgi:hypothetical protein|nr:hypothetical protein [Balneola sp.]MAO78204.1 hypothetical protein [Balneola sp.]MBF64205.1 hypothetical protein [Balneola sp.]|tara:strand:+ start:848 stop:1744 length:897 start_codon:yes stop_codon:yes gene_type:complete